MSFLAYISLLKFWTDGILKIQFYIYKSCDCECLNCLKEGLFWLFSRYTKISAYFANVCFLVCNIKQLTSVINNICFLRKAKSQNHLGWKGRLRSLSPTVKSATYQLFPDQHLLWHLQMSVILRNPTSQTNKRGRVFQS